jgi:hypothetical protein
MWAGCQVLTCLVAYRILCTTHGELSYEILVDHSVFIRSHLSFDLARSPSANDRWPSGLARCTSNLYVVSRSVRLGSNNFHARNWGGVRVAVISLTSARLVVTVNPLPPGDWSYVNLPGFERGAAVSRRSHAHGARWTSLKAVAGQFPAYFALLVGAPDLLFGLSALVFAWQTSIRQLSQRFLIAWNLIGVAVILPAAPLIQLGLPGPIQIFTSEPTAEKLLDFPMVLAPSIIVPTLVLLNLVMAWRLIETT